MRVLVACEESQAITKQFRKLGHKDRAKLRSKTFSGMAKAIATQYSEYIINLKQQI